MHHSLECVQSFTEGQEKGGTSNYTARTMRFPFTAFCVLVLPRESQQGEEKQIFSLAFFVCLDRNRLISCWWCAFENTWVCIPGIYLKYFKAAKDLLQGNSSDSHHACIFRGILQWHYLGRKCCVCTCLVCYIYVEFGIRCKGDISKHHDHLICYIIINYSTAVIIQMSQGIYSGKQGTFYNVIIRHWGDMTLFRVMEAWYG